MKILIAVDANIILSALLGGKSAVLLFDSRFEFMTTRFTMNEVERYLPKEGGMYVAYAPELDVSNCGYSLDEARKNLKDAVIGFLESARERGVLNEILQP